MSRFEYRPAWRYVLALAAITALAFAPAIGNGFVRWDDDRNILDNPAFNGLSLETVRWAWSTTLLGVYQPLGWLLMEAQFDACGLNPRGYHAVSVAMHAANVVVLWMLTLALLNRVSRGETEPDAGSWASRASAAAIVVALYAVHPLRAEVVAWASCQTYLPSALFAMLAVLAYLRACDQDRPARRLGWLVVTWALYTIALLMKVAPIMLPVVLLVLDVYPLRRLGPGRWRGREAWPVYREKLPFFAVALIFAVIALRARGVDNFQDMNAKDYDPVVRLVRAGVAPGFYLLKTVYPFDLRVFYPPPSRRIDYLSGISAAAIATTLMATAVAFAIRRPWPGLTASWVCYLVAIAPNLGLIRTGRTFLADRYSYLPSIAGVVLLAYALSRLTGRPRTWARSVALVLILGLLALNWRQCLDWKSTETLWTRAFECLPDDAQVNMALGVAQNRDGKTAEAKQHFLRALKIDPGYAAALVNLAGIAFNEGDVAGAEAAWERALKVDPKEPLALTGLGLVRETQGRPREAEPFYRRALEIQPVNTQTRNDLAAVLLRQGKLEEAASEFARASRDDPRDAATHYNLGQTLATLGRHNEALPHYIEAARLNPAVANTYAGMGETLLALKRDAEAARAFSAALGIDPNNAAARRRLDEIQARRAETPGL